jgi:ligand-binding sensor domain-containing protein
MKNYFYFTLIVISTTFYQCKKDEIQNNHFITDNLPGKYINAMALDSKGGLWFSTSEVDTSIHLPPFSEKIPIRYYLTRFYEATFEIIDDNFIGAEKMTIDKNDNLWFITSKTLYNLDSKKSTEIYKLPDQGGLFEWITTDQNNNIWVGGLACPLLKIVQDPDVQIVNTTNGLLSSTAGHFDNNNNLWIALWDNWIGKLDPHGIWTYYNPSNSSLPNLNFWCITSDRNNNIWAGTGWMNDVVNLVKFDGSKWVQMMVKDNLGNTIHGTVRQLYYDGMKIWIVSEVAVNNAFDSSYLITFNGSKWDRISGAPLKDGISGIEFDVIHNIAWIGTKNSGCIQTKIK